MSCCFEMIFSEVLLHISLTENSTSGSTCEEKSNSKNRKSHQACAKQYPTIEIRKIKSDTHLINSYKINLNLLAKLYKLLLNKLYCHLLNIYKSFNNIYLVMAMINLPNVQQLYNTTPYTTIFLYTLLWNVGIYGMGIFFIFLILLSLKMYRIHHEKQIQQTR